MGVKLVSFTVFNSYKIRSKSKKKILPLKDVLLFGAESSEVECKILLGKDGTHSQEWGAPGISVVIFIFSQTVLGIKRAKFVKPNKS